MDREQQRAAARAAASAQRPPVRVGLRAWGGDVFVKRPSWAAMSRLRRQYPEDDAEQSQARMVASSICDEAGNLTFDATSDADLELVGDQGADFINEIALAITSSTPGNGSAQTTNS